MCGVVACRYWLRVGLAHSCESCVSALFVCVFLGVRNPRFPVVVQVAGGFF